MIEYQAPAFGMKGVVIGFTFFGMGIADRGMWLAVGWMVGWSGRNLNQLYWGWVI